MTRAAVFAAGEGPTKAKAGRRGPLPCPEYRLSSDAAGSRRAVEVRGVVTLDAEGDAFDCDTVRPHGIERSQHAALTLEERIGEADEAPVRHCRVGGLTQGKRDGFLRRLFRATQDVTGLQLRRARTPRPVSAVLVCGHLHELFPGAISSIS